MKASSTPQREPILAIQAMSKVYQMGETAVHALQNVSLSISEGDYVAIIASGSGKSTLMNMIGLLDRPTTGSYKIRGKETSTLSKNEQADMRNQEIGFYLSALQSTSLGRRLCVRWRCHSFTPVSQAGRRANGRLRH